MKKIILTEKDLSKVESLELLFDKIQIDSLRKGTVKTTSINKKSKEIIERRFDNLQVELFDETLENDWSVTIHDRTGKTKAVKGMVQSIIIFSNKIYIIGRGNNGTIIEVDLEKIAY